MTTGELEERVAEVRARKWEFLPGLIAMSLIAIMGFAIVMLFMFPMPMTEAAGTLAVALVTAVTTNVGVIVGFFFGSSKTSREKDQVAAAQASTIANMASDPAKNGSTVAGKAQPPVP